MVEGEGQDEERTVAGHVHLERYVPLVQTNCLSFLGQRRLQQFSTDLLDGRKMLKWVRDIGCVGLGACGVVSVSWIIQRVRRGVSAQTYLS